jgi:hypothetical protein
MGEWVADLVETQSVEVAESGVVAAARGTGAVGRRRSFEVRADDHD